MKVVIEYDGSNRKGHFGLNRIIWRVKRVVCKENNVHEARLLATFCAKEGSQCGPGLLYTIKV